MEKTPLDGLSAEKMQMFVAGLSGLAPEEVRKAKVLYIRNAISEYRAAEEGMGAFNMAQGCFWVIPIFWPILFSQRKMVNSQLRLARQKIANAINVWRDDLRGETFEISAEELAS